MADRKTQLDIEQPAALIEYLRTVGRIAQQEPVEVRVLGGGVSNRTVLVRRESGEAWVLKQALAKLRVEVDWFSDPARIRREALAIRQLAELAPADTVPQFVFEDPQQNLLAMRAVAEPHENWKSMLLTGRLDDDHVRQFATLLATIHRHGHERREQLPGEFADRSFFESLRLEPYYAYSAEQVPQAAEFLTSLIETTRQRSDTLVHGDYSPKNILVHQGRLVLLDHEVVHLGDPAFDLGFSLTHLLSKAHLLQSPRAAFLDAAKMHWQVYRRQLGMLPWCQDLERRAVEHTLGCLLARVAGRSKLEYFDPAQRETQQHIVCQLIKQRPATVEALVEEFGARL